MRPNILTAVAIFLAEATASTVTLPLKSRAKDHQARGDGKFRLPGSRRYLKASSGVDVPVTDWFNRSDNQVRVKPCSISLCVMMTDNFTSGIPHLE